MLAGIGGSTIAQAQLNMSAGEVSQWSKFIREQGPLSLQAHYKQLESHLDLIAAKICWAVFRAAGSKDVKISDFMPDYTSDVQEAPASLNDVMGILAGSGAKKVNAKPPPKPKRKRKK